MSRVVSMRIKDEQMSRLARVARRLGRTPSETSALLVEEALRRGEFALIDFRDSPAGRQAYMQGSTLAVWEVVLVARGYDMSLSKTAEHLGWPATRVQAALNYARAYRQDIEQAISDNDAFDFEALSKMLPGAECFVAENEPGNASGE